MAMIIARRMLLRDAATEDELRLVLAAGDGLWLDMLRLAVRYGWQPAGAYAPPWWGDNVPWDGVFPDGYVKYGACITPRDANGLSNALRRALPDIPDLSGSPPAPRTTVLEEMGHPMFRASIALLMVISERGGLLVENTGR